MLSLFMNRKRPRAKFYGSERVVISTPTLVIECRYWVEWNLDTWHVDVVSVTDAEDASRTHGFAQVREIVTEALRGKKTRTIIVKEATPPTTTSSTPTTTP